MIKYKENTYTQLSEVQKLNKSKQIMKNGHIQNKGPTMFEFPGFFFFFFLLGMSVDHSNTKDYISKIMTKLRIECSCEGKFYVNLTRSWGAQILGQTLFLSVSVKMFPDEIYIRRYRLSKADCFPNVDGHHLLMRV